MTEPLGMESLFSDLDSNMRMFGMDPENKEHREAYVERLDVTEAEKLAYVNREKK